MLNKDPLQEKLRLSVQQENEKELLRRQELKLLKAQQETSRYSQILMRTSNLASGTGSWLDLLCGRRIKPNLMFASNMEPQEIEDADSDEGGEENSRMMMQPRPKNHKIDPLFDMEMDQH